MRLSENAILARIRDLFPGGGDLTDDCGRIPPAPPGGTLLVTTDLMEDGQHFSRDWHPPALLGRKLLLVNLSDLDASGAVPTGFTLTLALGRDLEADWVDAFLRGLAQAARETGVPVLGGDTVGRDRGLGLGITAFGTARRWLRRDTLETGDGLYADQELGASLRGLRKLQAGQDPLLPDPDVSAHLDPRPRIGLGPRLAAIPEVHACMDISDGLSRDLRTLALASGRSIVLDPGLTREAIAGGEDYARCFSSSLPRPELERLLGIPLIPVGTAVDPGEGPLLHYDGDTLRPMPDLSFDHFAPTPRKR
ncbi:thiamine-phosphate kinase [Mesoterricola silvestris]|uniref:Thiamine-monophosphate kinase n=1 Tax=Mesoterricola silvestris TaxID=2927979 RepID=A0AA48GQN6_9BACT|nr:AIR synthase related protein [Mesoterricola silvestris]BDU72242.1 thiamine-monophosphate kinase [Mesoterricola silvestris]